MVAVPRRRDHHDPHVRTRRLGLGRRPRQDRQQLADEHRMAEVVRRHVYLVAVGADGRGHLQDAAVADQYVQAVMGELGRSELDVSEGGKVHWDECRGDFGVFGFELGGQGVCGGCVTTGEIEMCWRMLCQCLDGLLSNAASALVEMSAIGVVCNSNALTHLL